MRKGRGGCAFDAQVGEEGKMPEDGDEEGGRDARAALRTGSE